ncbi:MAG: NADH-quinone oxidoreductase subunit NuoE [Chloroflexi bacterium]|nr:NADH-quinone oxidoreductase subunit NuoE [Chloroflexota bacterium]
MENGKNTIRELITPIIKSFKAEKSNIIPMLQKIQKSLGYLPEEALIEVARYLNESETRVYGVATFYAQFKFEPTGKRVIKICRGTACHVRGATRIIDEVSQYMGIKPGETTKDMEYTLETTACFGSCALAPVIVLDNDVHGKVSVKKVRDVLEESGFVSEGVKK